MQIEVVMGVYSLRCYWLNECNNKLKTQKKNNILDAKAYIAKILKNKGDVVCWIIENLEMIHRAMVLSNNDHDIRKCPQWFIVCDIIQMSYWYKQNIIKW